MRIKCINNKLYLEITGVTLCLTGEFSDNTFRVTSNIVSVITKSPDFQPKDELIEIILNGAVQRFKESEYNLIL